MSSTVKARPAETGGAVAGALAFLLCYLLGVDDAGVLTALGVVLAFVPASITWAVELARSGGKV